MEDEPAKKVRVRRSRVEIAELIARNLLQDAIEVAQAIQRLNAEIYRGWRFRLLMQRRKS